MSKNLAEEQLAVARELMRGTHALPTGSDPTGLPLRKLVAAAFRSRLLLVTTVLLSVSIGTFLAVTTPNTYLSQGKFLFTASGSEAIAVDPTAGGATEGVALASAAAHVLKANELLRRVAEEVTPSVLLAPYQPEDDSSTGLGALLHKVQRDWNAGEVKEASLDDALRVLAKRLQVDRLRNTDVLLVTYAAHDPQLAQRVLSVYMDKAKKWHQEQYDDPRAHAAIVKSAGEARSSREGAALALRSFLVKEARVKTSFEFELTQVLAAEANASSQVEANLLSITGMRRQIQTLGKRLEATKPMRKVRRRMSSNVAVERFMDEIASLQLRRTNVLLTAVGSTSQEDVAAIDKRIAALQMDLGQAQKRQSEAPEFDVDEANPDYVTLRGALAKLRTDLLAAEVMTNQYREIHESSAAELKRLRELEPRHQALSEALDRAVLDVTRTSESLVAAERKRQLQLGNYSSLKAIEAASLPLEKEGPNRAKLLIGGLLVGLFLGITFVFLRTLPDSTVRDRGDLEAIDGLAVIGVLPKLDGRNVRRHEAARVRGG